MEEKNQEEKKGLECFIRENENIENDILYIISVEQYIHKMFKEI